MISTLVEKMIDNMLEEEHELEVEEQRKGEVKIIFVYVSDCLLELFGILDPQCSSTLY